MVFQWRPGPLVQRVAAPGGTRPVITHRRPAAAAACSPPPRPCSSSAAHRPPPGDLHDHPLVDTRTGNSRAFAADHAPWTARYDASDPGPPPAGWSTWTFRRYDNGGGALPGDQNLFDGPLDRMKGSPGAPEGPRRGASRTERRRLRHPTERPPPLTVTATPVPVHLPFTLVTYVQPVNDLERMPG